MEVQKLTKTIIDQALIYLTYSNYFFKFVNYKLIQTVKTISSLTQLKICTKRTQQ